MEKPRLVSGRDALVKCRSEHIGASVSPLDFHNAGGYAILEPKDAGECLQFAEIAEKYAAKLKVKFLMYMTADTARCVSSVRESELPQLPGASNMAELAENCPFNVTELRPSSVGVIACGNGYNLAKEIYGDTVSYLKLGMIYPISRRTVAEFSARCDEIVVIDETGMIEPFLEKEGISCVGKDRIGSGEYKAEALKLALLCIEPDFTEIADEIPERD